MSTSVTTGRRARRNKLPRHLPPAQRTGRDRRLPSLWLGAMVILFAFALRTMNIRSVGDGNPYYTATVYSMVLSPGNLFFAAAEPGGSVSVDKPPLGFWVQALSTLLLGRSGFAVIWPQIAAGVVSVAVVNRLVRRHFGASAGLIAALALAALPVNVAVDRNNTVDGLLILSILLAAWAFLNATENESMRRRWSWLVAGAVLIGIGFNIKGLPALLPAPALFGLYLLGSSERVSRRLLQLLVAGVVAGAISLSWAVVLDATPADRRPYVGSSTTNSAVDLMIGYNGLARLFGILNVPATPAPAVPAGPAPAAPPPPRGGLPSDLDGGQPGLLRFFNIPLAKELTWLLPLGLSALGFIALRGRARLPLCAPQHAPQRAALLWGGWLITGLIVFSLAGFLHAHYVALLGPPLAALTGSSLAEMGRIYRTHRGTGWLLIELAGAWTLTAQWSILTQVFSAALIWIIALVIFVVALAALALRLWRATRISEVWERRALVGVAAALLILPITWGALTASEPQPDVHLPAAYAGDTTFGEKRRTLGQGPIGLANPVLLLLYLEPRTFDVEYVLAVPDANAGAPFVLGTRRPVLYIGGFLGTDPIIDGEGLQQMVAAGKLRYVWDAGGQLRRSRPDITAWLYQSCRVVPPEELRQAGAPNTPGSPLYECR
ncbi:MAG: glycosyltransferase family 39 protein [Anaerolineae bacterium]|nr:glycosyltransferase family 39 protein [Thermoflexales bacterium]MDW8408241.1 glycosyltransferase family 39 protein [Anaerolineae bacterium]